MWYDVMLLNGIHDIGFITNWLISQIFHIFLLSLSEIKHGTIMCYHHPNMEQFHHYFLLMIKFHAEVSFILVKFTTKYSIPHITAAPLRQHGLKFVTILALRIRFQWLTISITREFWIKTTSEIFPNIRSIALASTKTLLNMIGWVPTNKLSEC